jgi:hypothetical protein
MIAHAALPPDDVVLSRVPDEADVLAWVATPENRIRADPIDPSNSWCRQVSQARSRKMKSR